MDYLFDMPIVNEMQDILHRSQYAKQFAKNLVSLSQSTSFTVSLNGGWGSGKTSLINLIKNQIEYIQNYDEEIEAYPVILNFAPWNTLEENAIIKQFFNSFSSVFKKTKIKQFLKDKRTQLALKILEDLPYIGKNIQALHKMFDRYLKGLLGEEDDLLTIKNEIISKLEKSKFKYIVFIDDIDRLNNKEIRLLIQLVKAVCDFPNVVYVLSFDRDIVANALKEEQGIDGYVYLEKIIQLSISMPEIRKEDLQHYLFQKIDNVLVGIENDEFNRERWAYIFRNNFGEYFNTLRNINRYINSVQFKYENYKKVLDLVDFLAMEAISLFEPKLLNLIAQNRSFLCGGVLEEDKKERIKTFRASVEAISKNFNLLTILFPVLQNNYLGDYREELNIHQLKSLGRISFIDNFNFYLAGELCTNGISKDDVRTVLWGNTADQNKQFFRGLTNRSYNTFLQFLYGFSKESKHIEKIVLFLPQLMDFNLTFENLTGLFIFPNSMWIVSIIEEILKYYGKEKTLEFLKQLYMYSNDYETLIQNMYEIAKGTDFYSETIEGNSNFSKDEILELHLILVDRLSKEMERSKFFENPNLITILYFLKDRNRKLVQTWYDNERRNILKVLDELLIIGYGEGFKRFRTYFFCHDVFDEFIDMEQIKKTLVYI